ncbi:MAG: ankyrin repeat domain-containing protein [Nitrospira sp.]
MRNHEAVVVALLKMGASVHTRNAIGWTPLHDAACNGNASLIDLLLNHNAEINAEDETGNTPAAVAVLNGEERVAQHLRARGGQSHIW